MTKGKPLALQTIEVYQNLEPVFCTLPALLQYDLKSILTVPTCCQLKTLDLQSFSRTISRGLEDNDFVKGSERV